MSKTLAGHAKQRDRETRPIFDLRPVVHGLASLELRGTLGPPAEAEEAWQSTMLAVTTGLFGAVK